MREQQGGRTRGSGAQGKHKRPANMPDAQRLGSITQTRRQAEAGKHQAGRQAGRQACGGWLDASPEETTRAAQVDSAKDPNRSAPMPAMSPTLSPTLSAGKGAGVQGRVEGVRRAVVGGQLDEAAQCRGARLPATGNPGASPIALHQNAHFSQSSTIPFIIPRRPVKPPPGQTPAGQLQPPANFSPPLSTPGAAAAHRR